MGFTVRPARAEDLEEIRRFTAATFEWGDYVADEFLGWLEDPMVEVVVVAGADDRPVAVARAMMLSSTELWLASARVAPDRRRQGIGTMLNDSGVEWGRGRGATVARLVTEARNEAARAQVTKLGYRPVSTWLWGEREVDEQTEPAAPERLVTAGEEEVEAALAAWGRSELGLGARGLFAVAGWGWRKLVPADLTAAARVGRLFGGPPGWLMGDVDRGAFHVPWLATDAGQAHAMGEGMASLAAGMGAGRITLHVPDVGWLREALTGQGFEVAPTVVYEKGI